MKRRINESDRTGPQATKQFNDRDCGHRRARSNGFFWEKLADYSSENTSLRPAVPRGQPLAGSVACSDWCAICFRTQRSEGKNFEAKGGMKNQASRNFGFWLTTTSKVGGRCWMTGIIACERSNEGRKDPVNGTAASLQLPSGCRGLFFNR